MNTLLHGLTAAVGAAIGVVLGYYFYALPRIRRENSRLCEAMNVLNKRHLDAFRELIEEGEK